jgi:hypothetical protein
VKKAVDQKLKDVGTGEGSDWWVIK